MSISKVNIAIYAGSGIAVFLVLFLFAQNRKLTRQLSEVQQELLAVDSVDDRSVVSDIDSMMLHGDFQQAIAQSQLLLADTNNANAEAIRMRMAFAKLLTAAKPEVSNVVLEASKYRILDSVVVRMATPAEVREHDSLVFALEKARSQLSRLKNQQSRRAYGEYLAFQSARGNFVHYVGAVKDGKANGRGVGIFDTGSRYVGEWKDNLKHGEGDYFWEDGQHYQGSYQDDKRNGYGVYYWPNGEKFAGYWSNNTRNGEGTFYDEKGNIKAEGTWVDDKLVKAKNDK